jgi:hypothetical protein
VLMTHVVMMRMRKRIKVMNLRENPKFGKPLFSRYFPTFFFFFLLTPFLINYPVPVKKRSLYRLNASTIYKLPFDLHLHQLLVIYTYT